MNTANKITMTRIALSMVIIILLMFPFYDLGIDKFWLEFHFIEILAFLLSFFNVYIYFYISIV